MKNPRKIIVYFFNFLLLSVPLYFRFVNEELFEFNKMILVYALTAIIVFFWFIRMVQEKKLILKSTPLDIPIILFVASQVVSTIFSIHPRTSLLGYYSRFNGGLLSTISYVLLFYAFISNVRKKDLPGVLISTFTSGILVSMYGILEHFGHSISCLIVPGLKDFSVNCWKQDVQSRVFATFGQPNWLAAYAITILPLGIVLTIQKKYKLSQKLFFTISSTLLFTVLLFTRSRSGLVGFAGGSLFLLIGLLITFFKNKKAIDLKFTAILTAIILVITGIFGTMFIPSFQELVGRNKENISQNETVVENKPIVDRLESGGTDSGEIRKIVWQGAMKIWERYPIIGSGVETFAYSYYQDRPREHNDVSEWDFLYNKAHNELINLLSTSGLFGLATYLSILITFGVLVLKRTFSDKNTGAMPIAILAGIISLFISNFFGFSTVMVNVLMFILFGIFIVLNQKEKDETKEYSKEKKYKINSPEQYFAVTMLIIFLLVILMKIYNYWDADRLFSQGKVNFSSGNFLVGIQKQIEAIQKSPNEALFYDNLSDDYAKLAVELARTGQTTASASIINEAIKSSDLAIKNNNRHLNFYKTRSRVFLTLSQLDNRFLTEAEKTLDEAMKLSPTDPKLVYTQGVVKLGNDNNELGQQLIERAIDLKPNYERARLEASEIYEKNGEISKAIEQLQYILDNISPGNEEARNKVSELEML